MIPPESVACPVCGAPSIPMLQAVFSGLAAALRDDGLSEADRLLHARQVLARIELALAGLPIRPHGGADVVSNAVRVMKQATGEVE